MNKEEVRSRFYEITLPKIIWNTPLSEEDRKLFKEWKEGFNPNMELFEHYKDKRVLFEIVKSLGNSELCLNENIRHLYASKIEYLLKIFYFYRILEHKGENAKGDKTIGMTFYKGLANFGHREAPPFGIEEKRKWQDKWNEEYQDKTVGYNFGLDLDGKTFNDSYKDAKKVFDFFKKFNIRFSIWCSGKKGFHFIIPYEEFEELVEPFELGYTISYCKGFMLDLIDYLKLKKVDSGIYGPSRYLKNPYGLDSRNLHVILPLSDEEFLDFPNNPEKYMSIEYCHSMKDLGNRGTYINRPSNKEGFKKMIKELGEKL